MEAARSSNTRSPTARLLQLLLTLSSPAAASSRVIAKACKNKRVQLKAEHGGGAFECRTCGRRFAMFQALGGHRTSHKRPRVCARGLDLLLGARPGRASAPVQHRCGTCGQTFATGQALGGHMRRHRPVSVLGAGAVATVTSTSTEAAMSSSSWSSSGLSSEGDDEAWPTLIQFI